MMPRSKKTRKLTTQKATNSLTGVYQAGSVLQLCSAKITSEFVPTDVLGSTSLADAFSMLAEGPNATATLRSGVPVESAYAD